MIRYFAGAVAACALIAAGPASAQDKLTVFWGKGFYKAEDDALFAAVKKFEEKTKVKVDISQYPPQDMIPKTVAAMDSGTPPDVAYGDVFDFQVAGKWAFEGKLEDISDIINPLKGQFAPNTVETTFLYSDKTKKSAYYAFPMKQQTMHIQYWIDMLGRRASRKAISRRAGRITGTSGAARCRRATGRRPARACSRSASRWASTSSDSFYSFLTFMDAYNVKLVDDNGKLLVDDPKVREGLIGALKDYTDIYTRGCTPPSSSNWKDPDNNVAFHNKTSILTHNATISIVAKWVDDSNNATFTQEQRDQAKKNVDENIATAGFPNKPDGKPMVYRTAVKVGVIFADSKNKAKAKEFVQFMLQEENLTPYVEGALGRWFPVTKTAQESKFWQENRHKKAVYDQYKAGTVTFEFTKNYKFTILNNENVWAKAMNRVVSEKVPVDKAVDEMIARIKQVAG